MDRESPLGLGSASPRRRELLERLGIPLKLLPQEVDESRRTDEAPGTYLERIVLDKLHAAARGSCDASMTALLVADTIVVVEDEILGKPSGAGDAERMLSRLSGRSHEVRTRFAIGRARPGDPPAELLHAETVVTTVSFRPLDAEEIARYARTGEGLDKAGAYAVQGVGSFAVARIDGSYANVVGLPVCEVVVALRRLGLLGPFP
jgi:nucleoside triphosphate pyrophosphatase